MTTEERLERLTIVTSAHGDRIESLIWGSESNREHISARARIEVLIATFQQQAARGAESDRRLESIRILVEESAKATANLERQWQTYINMLPRQ